MAFEPTFGSVGDFIAVGLLIKDVVRALDDARGSSKQYQDTVKSLKDLNNVLDQVQQAVQASNRDGALPELHGAITSLAGDIRSCLEEFVGRIKKYEGSLGACGSGNCVKDFGRKIQWKFGEKDVAAFHADVDRHTRALQLLLDTTALEVLGRNRDALERKVASEHEETRAAARRNMRSLQVFQAYICTSILARLNSVASLGEELKKFIFQILFFVVMISTELRSLRDVVMRLERPLSDEYFTLEDAMGYVFPIHLRTITSWDVLEYVLRDRFKGRKGARRVLRRRYVLRERGTLRELSQALPWERAFKPHQKVDMSLMCRESGDGLSNCPRCKAVTPSGVSTEVECENCNMRFTRVVEVENNDIEPGRARVFSELFLTNREKGRQRSIRDESPNVGSSARLLSARSGQSQEGLGPSAPSDDDLGSDEEDITDLARVVLASKRRQERVPRLRGWPWNDPTEGKQTDRIKRGGVGSEKHSGPVKRKRESKSLACPFYKHDPLKHMSSTLCSFPGFPTIARLKDHIYRNHRNRHLCIRCGERFTDDDALQHHLHRTEPCTIIAGTPYDGIDSHQEERIRALLGRGDDAVTQWVSIYRIIFPDKPGALIPSDVYWEPFTITVAPDDMDIDLSGVIKPSPDDIELFSASR